MKRSHRAFGSVLSAAVRPHPLYPRPYLLPLLIQGWRGGAKCEVRGAKYEVREQFGQRAVLPLLTRCPGAVIRRTMGWRGRAPGHRVTEITGSRPPVRTAWRV